MTDYVQPYGVELTDGDIDDLRDTGELVFRYDTPPDEDDVEIVLEYGSGGGGDRSNNHRVERTLE